MQMGMQLMKTLFSMASLMGGMVLDFQAPDFFTGEVDAGSVLFWWFMGFLYFFIALICGMLIFLTLFSRYVKLYLLTVTFPLAMPPEVNPAISIHRFLLAEPAGRCYWKQGN